MVWMLLNGELINEVDEDGDMIKDDILLVLVNSFWEQVRFKLPNTELAATWEVLVDTSESQFRHFPLRVETEYIIPPRSLVLLRNMRIYEYDV